MHKIRNNYGLFKVKEQPILALLPFIALIIWAFMMPVMIHAMELDGEELTEIVDAPDGLVLDDVSEDAAQPEILSEDGLTSDGFPDITPDTQSNDVGGYCGKTENNLVWTVSKSEGSEDFDTLTISKNPVGTEISGDNFDMMDFSNNSSDANYYQKAPWYPYKDEITTVIIEDGVTSVGAYSFFYDYSAIKTVTIGNSVTTIKRSAFWKCIGITEITIPASVTHIGNGAFGLCSLRTINFEKEDNIVYVEGSAFDTQGALWLQDKPSGMVYIGHVAYYYKGQRTETVTFREGTTMIAGGVFANGPADNVKSVIIPEGVTNIDAGAFQWTGLTSVIIPASVTHIGNGAFYNCGVLENVYIFCNTTDVDERAFYKCSRATFGFCNRDGMNTKWHNAIQQTSGKNYVLMYSITAPEGVDISDANGHTVFYGGKFYMTSNTEITLKHSATPPEGYGAPFLGFTVTGSDGSVIETTKNGDVYTFTLPQKDVTVEEMWSRLYKVTVNKGELSNEKTSGWFVKDDNVTVKANAPAIGKKFKKWDVVTTEGVIVTPTKGSWTTSEVSFDMPEGDVILTATYEDIEYSVTVINGTGTGNYKYGQTVNISANAPEAGKKFKEWTSSDGVTFANSKNANTSFKMLAKAVTVKATYEDIIYTVKTTNDGHGSATADPASGKMGTSVTIKATSSSGYEFKEWVVVSGGITLADKNKAITTFEIKNANVEVQALFEQKVNPTPDPTPEPEKTDISKATVKLSAKSFIYNKKTQKPVIKSVTLGKTTLKVDKDYTVSYSNKSSKNAGTYTVLIKGKDNYTGSVKAKYTIQKADNPLKVNLKKKELNVKLSKLKTKDQTIGRDKYLKALKNEGTVTYKKTKGNSKISVNKKNGKITVKKGLKKGSYSLTMTIKAAGNKNYKASSTKKVTVKIVVK